MLEFLFGKAHILTPEQKLDQDIERVLDEVAEGLQHVRWEIVRSARTGERLSRLRGPGIEFQQLRDFIPGQDEMRMLHSRQTMKRGGAYGQWVVRENRPELINIDLLMMDVSPTHNFGMRESKLWLSARAGATAALCTQKAGDLLGFVAYADNQVVHRLRPSPPKRILHNIIGTILEPPAASGDLSSGAEDAFSALPSGRTNITWITDGLNLDNPQRDLVAGLRDRHNIRVVIPQDYREWMLPEPKRWWPFPYRLKVFDLTTHRHHTFTCTKRFRRQYTEEFMAHTQDLQNFFDQVGIACAFIHTEYEVQMRDYATELERAEAIAKHRMDQVIKVQQLLTSR